MDKNTKLNNNLANSKTKTSKKDLNLDNKNSNFNQADNSLNNQSNLNYKNQTKGNTI
ncbi:hypothetical protein CBLAS_1451 [Campylobacter blaseri]|uniref:hypothetical protein n=1 Tax=Campylobacter blaseri TaxID=2042961 RepID=UPI0012FFFC1E|nr:hypothetical protein [Campylobacter blaseri]QKF86615.1 hypothetical protein CBLAS_1451 [Campylobacter blaseri]